MKLKITRFKANGVNWYTRIPVGGRLEIEAA
jgi:hypothetical protein